MASKVISDKDKEGIQHTFCLYQMQDIFSEWQLSSKHTKEQSEEQLWHDMRRVRLTSTAKKVPARPTTSPDKFLADHLHPTFHGNSAIHHGTKLQDSL